MQSDILIIGGGPTGIGAASRLMELCEPFLLVEKAEDLGGLARSVQDKEGFCWDLGGHVQFSHYQKFGEYMDLALPQGEWLHHERQSWVYLMNRFIPYPFQNNLHRLPPEACWACVEGLLQATQSPATTPVDFEQWIHATFGAGIAELFLLPYNFKVWAYPPGMMNYQWIGDRVSVPPLEQVLRAVCLHEDQVSWGPNATFKFPKRGGTGAIWKSLAARLPDRSVLAGRSVVALDAGAKLATLDSGEQIRYEVVISTMPLDRLLCLLNGGASVREREALLFSSTHVVGVGLKGELPEQLVGKCWMYYPEDNCPFYRVTVFSNYSPYNTPDPGKSWSLMAEVSESPQKAVEAARVVEETLQGMRNVDLIHPGDTVLSLWHRRLEHGYPTPALHREQVLPELLRELESQDIYSRGRFGSWRYEVSNQDHSFMQGMEVVERVICGHSELTLFRPDLVNSRHNAFPYPEWYACRAHGTRSRPA